ncbi:MAG: sugar phosphate isomerase/epimerase family protein [Thermomicrobiales bacterium]
MQAVLFTKLFRGQSLEDIAVIAAELGFDGVDLLIRPGHQLEPTVPENIRDGVRLLERAGLAVPMATTDLTDPSRMPTERLLASCAEADIGLVRLGYWRYDQARGYAACFDAARRHLDELERLAAQAGVRLAVQLHGNTIHGSGAQTAALLADHDPAHIGAYPDPGNQVVQDGREDWRFTFDVLRPWLCCVGMKNGGWFPADLAPSGQRHWRSDWLGIPDGMVPWDEVVTYLARSGFDGPLSFHSHYEVPLRQVLEQTRLDLQFIRALIEAQVASPAMT